MDYFEYLRLIRDSNLSTKARIVALIIASYNPSFPTNKLIAKGTGLSERTVRTAKAELVAAGYLRQKAQWNAANIYTPQAPVAAGEARDYHLNTNINTNLNTKEIQTKKSSNEDLVLSNINIIKEDITMSNDSANSSLAKVKAMAADDIWAVFESR
jgi:hypothetical protein